MTRKLSLGPNELKLLFTLEEQGKTAFRFEDARRILKTSSPSIKNVLYRLKRKGRIEKIEKGKYLLIPAKAGYKGIWSEHSFLILPHLLDSYYVGFYSALNYWGMTEQVPSMVLVATTARKKELEYGFTRYKFITLSKKKFFGLVEEEISGGKFKISSKEKTVLDCLMYPKYCGGLDEAAKGIWEESGELDFDKLLSYARRLNVTVVSRRLGYILEMLNVGKDVSEKIASMKFKGYMWLDPLGPRKVLGYSKKYGLIINRTNKEMTSWMGY